MLCYIILYYLLSSAILHQVILMHKNRGWCCRGGRLMQGCCARKALSTQELHRRVVGVKMTISSVEDYLNDPLSNM